nr:PREDICTED: uncharacterized protein LOC109039254 [Bemisia tabaci]
MKCTLSHRILTYLIIFILVSELVPGVQGGKNGSDGEGKKKKHWWSGIFKRKKDPTDTREKVIGPGGSLKIRSGDTVITSLLPNRFALKPPYRWFYALNNEGTVIHFLPPLHKWFHNVRPVLIDVRKKYKRAKLMNRGQKHGHVGKVGALVAALMFESSKKENQKQKFHFNLFWCNCKHYVEYLSLGRVEGSYKHVLFQPMDKKCPLYAPLTSDMYTTIFENKEFELHDNQERTKQVRIKLKIHGHWPAYVWDSKAGK